MKREKFVGCNIGNSAGVAPLRIRPVWPKWLGEEAWRERGWLPTLSAPRKTEFFDLQKCHAAHFRLDSHPKKSVHAK
jgi:hypothetical protein